MPAGGVRSIHHAKTNYEVGSPVAVSSSPPGTTNLLGSTTTTTPQPPAPGHISTSYTVGGASSSPGAAVPAHRGVSDPGVLAAALPSTGGANSIHGGTSILAAERGVLSSGGRHGGGGRAGAVAVNGTAGAAAVGSSVNSLAPAASAGAAATAGALAAAAGESVVLQEQQQQEPGEQSMEAGTSGGAAADGQEVHQLKRLLSVRESELASLRQQLALLAKGH